MHDHHPHKDPSALRTAFFLNLGFTVIEVIGGILTNSVAILADALHDLGDSISLGIAWWFGDVAEKQPPNDRHTYGYKRLSLLASLINAAVLTAGSAIVITQALPRLAHPEPNHAPGMMLLAVLGMVVNGWAALKTSHGQSLNEQVISWHLLEDVLGWAAVFVGAVIMHFTKWSWIDPLLALGIAAFILFNILGKLKQIIRLFLQSAPHDIDVEALRTAILSIPEVDAIHHFHIWSLDGADHVLTMHAQLSETVSLTDFPKVKATIREKLDEQAFAHVAIELDAGAVDCSMAAPSDHRGE